MSYGDENRVWEIIEKLCPNAVHCNPISGGLTNRNYKISLEKDIYVLRIGVNESSSHGINRHTEYGCASAAHKAGISPEIIGFFPDDDVLITRYIQGKPLSATEIRQPHMTRRVAELIKRCHSIQNFPGLFSACDTIKAYLKYFSSYDIALTLKLEKPMILLQSRLDSLAPYFSTLGACHNDLVPSNFIDDGDKIWLIDWEYAGMGNVFFDMGNLAGNCMLDTDQEQTLLCCYFGCCEESMWSRLHLMRALSYLREGLWGLMQSRLAENDFDFIQYSKHQLECFQEILIDLKVDNPD